MDAALEHRGLTLVELMVCVAIAAVLLTIAVPGMQAFLARRQLEGLSAQFVADLQYARTAAVARGERLRLRFQTIDSGSCYLLHSSAADTCTCLVDQPPQCSGNAEALRVVYLPSSDHATVRANVGSMLIDPRQGTVSPSGSVEITSSDGVALRHVVNILGRVRLCTPATRINHVPACS
ncbi:MAG: GspH/FimT family pseudopilin [Burkholderiales bacterium]|nr:GspH/FimT family pseudopilin [Burkholderiales bacterium]